MANSETSVGGIVGFLRLDNRDFIAGINEAIRKTEILDGKRVDIEVDADTVGVDAKLTATERHVDKLDQSTAKVGKTARQTRGHVGALATAILTLGPSLIPVAAGAAGLAVAFGGMGAAGVAAIVGINKEMDAGTETGLEFRAALDSAKTDLLGLSKVAATGVLRPFQDVVADLSARMPALSDQMGDLAAITGRTAGALVGGLLNAFQTLEPLMRDAAVHVLGMSTAFERAMSGPGVVAFGEYVRSVLPQVLDALGSIAGAASHLVQSLAPLGLGVLTGLQVLSDLLSALPVDVLSTLATSAAAMFIGFKSWSAISGLIGGVNGALGRMNATLALSAGALRGLNIAAGVIGVALAALTWIVTRNAEAQREHEQAVNDLTDALIRSNGVVDEQIRNDTRAELAKRGVLDAAQELGLNLADVTDAYLGNAEAAGRVNDALEDQKSKFTEVIAVEGGFDTALTATGEKAAFLRGEIKRGADEMVGAKTGFQQYSAAAQDAAGALSNTTIAAQSLANQFGVSVPTYQKAAESQKGIADKAAAATLQMQLENNAAGLLKQSLDALNGETVTYQTALNGFERGMITLGQATRDTDGKIDKSKTTLKGAGEAAVTNRSNLLNLAQAAATTAEAYGNQTDSAEAGRLKLIELRDQIIKNAIAQGMNKDEVKAFIEQVLKIPPTVPPTVAQLDTAEALRKKKALQDAINALTGKTVTLTIKQVYQTYGSQAALSIQNTSKLLQNGIRDNEFGGLYQGGVRKMAEGGFAGRESQIMRTTRPILWNEAPGGEAYISLAPQKRNRSRAIWEETGRMLGADPGARGLVQNNEFHMHDGATPKDVAAELGWAMRTA